MSSSVPHEDICAPCSLSSRIPPFPPSTLPDGRRCEIAESAPGSASAGFVQVAVKLVWAVLLTFSALVLFAGPAAMW